MNLAHAVCYLATRPEVERLHVAIERGDEGREGGPHAAGAASTCKDSHYRGAKEEFGHGVGYKYAHDFEGGWVDQEYIPADVEYYQPTDRGHEAKIKARAGGIAEAEGEAGRR